MVSSIEQNDLHNPVQLFVRESSKSIRRRCRRRSMYRELLFLAIVALGRDRISYGECGVMCRSARPSCPFLDAFDREYTNVYQKLNDKERQLVHDFDKCPSLAAIMCRRLFSSLEL